MQISQKLCDGIGTSFVVFVDVVFNIGVSWIAEEDALFSIREVSREANRTSWICKSSALVTSDTGISSPLSSFRAESKNDSQRSGNF